MDKKNNQNDNPNKKKNIKSTIILLVVCLWNYRSLYFCDEPL